LLNLSIERRRELLVSVLAAPEEPLRLSPQLRAPSGQVLAAVRKLGLESVVGKRIDSTYETRRAIRRVDQAPHLRMGSLPFQSASAKHSVQYAGYIDSPS
jgi:hypothetical protein